MMATPERNTFDLHTINAAKKKKKKKNYTCMLKLVHRELGEGGVIKRVKNPKWSQEII